MTSRNARAPDEPDTQPAAKRDAARSRRAILDAALMAFSEFGHAGARVDAIAHEAGVSKPLIYNYFGDKDALYAAALREAYVQIREGERELELSARDPEGAIRALVRFTLNHFRSKPWFIRMLNTENLRGGVTIRTMTDASDIQSPFISGLSQVLARGADAGRFRSDVDPVDVYMMIAALCYFPVSNQHTLGTVFRRPLDDAWFERHGRAAEEAILAYLRMGATGPGGA